MIIASSKSLIPSPVLALTPIESEVSIPIISLIWFFTEFWSADWRSILLSTGIIWWFVSSAWYTFARVWASTPCELSTIRTEPSQASSDLLTS